MHEAASRGQSALFFLIPFASLGQVQRHWEEYRWWALARVAALLATAVGLALLFLTQGSLIPGIADLPGTPQSGQVLRGDQRAQSTAFVSSEEAAMLSVKGEGKPLSGRLHGRDFHYQRVALIDGVLTISQGGDFLPDLEVRILIGWDADSITERRTLLINPSDNNGPVVHLSWKPKDKDYPETRIFKQGYKLQLTLAPLDKEQLTGSLVLIMPDSYKSYLVGDFTAYTNHLRYRNGKVDLHYDHEDTLAHVGRQYLQTQFPEGAIDSIHIEHVEMHRSEGTGKVLARVSLVNGAIEERSLGLEKISVGWSVVPGSMTVSQLQAARPGGVQLVQPGQQKARVEVVTPEPITVSFPELVAYQGQQVTLSLLPQGSLQGVVERVGTDRLWLQTAVGSGSVERTVEARNLKSLLLPNGQTVTLTQSGEQPGETTPATSPSPAPASQPAQPVEDEDAVSRAELPELQTLVGKKVEVTANGNTRRGVLKDVQGDHLTLSVPMGAGNMEYFYDLDSITHLEALH